MMELLYPNKWEAGALYVVPIPYHEQAQYYTIPVLLEYARYL